MPALMLPTRVMALVSTVEMVEITTAEVITETVVIRVGLISIDDPKFLMLNQNLGGGETEAQRIAREYRENN